MDIRRLPYLSDKDVKRLKKYLKAYEPRTEEEDIALMEFILKIRFTHDCRTYIQRTMKIIITGTHSSKTRRIYRPGVYGT